MKRSVLVLSIALVLVAVAVLSTATLQLNSNQATTTSFFQQRTTSWTFTSSNQTMIRVCGNTPWNDSVLAHCGNIPVTANTPVPEFTEIAAMAFSVLAVYVCLLRRRRP